MEWVSMLKSGGTIALVLAGMMALAGCKIIKTPTAEEAAQAASGGFDPERMVAEIWDSKVLPYLDGKAVPFSEVASLAASDPDAAGSKYGHKEKQGSSPWTFAARLSGTIVKAETKSRSAYVEVDADGDGKADARVQIGPAIRGTAIRDSLDFVNFNEFKNQIEWAQYGKAFNTHVNDLVLEKLSRDQLVGKRLEAVGAYPEPAKGQLPLFVPVQLTVDG
jgi:predicted lipoprotein